MVLLPAGNQWLKVKLKLTKFTLRYKSFIGSHPSIRVDEDGDVERVFGPKYSPAEDQPLNHLEFALKYDDLNLHFFTEVFNHIPSEDIEQYIESQPSGKYSRKIGFLYEMLTGKMLTLSTQVTGNYVDILDPSKYITGDTRKDQRWRVNNNLLGNPHYCPVVKRTAVLNELLSRNIALQLDNLRKEFTPEVFRRAAQYLYKKETRSSYEIEREEPSPDRMDRFIQLLESAGKSDLRQLLTEKELTELQNSIVDPRFAASGFRDFQNFIGQSLPGGGELIYYICPPPSMVGSMMSGLWEMSSVTLNTPPEIRAALISFGFVYIHPFEDGNGRIHRFLIHDMLVRDQIVPNGLIIPVSAHMLNHLKEYDTALEAFSKPAMKMITYTMNDKSEVTISNEESVEPLFRYPDLTQQCTYLLQTLHATLSDDIPKELNFIQRYDEVRKSIQQIVDMPDKLINLMILFLHQNKGIFPKRRRDSFSKLTDEEIQRIQQTYRKIFELPVIEKVE